ncbi:MAG: hypothetical protein ACPGVY_11705 [Mycobacterium sp.]
MGEDGARIVDQHGGDLLLGHPAARCKQHVVVDVQRGGCAAWWAGTIQSARPRSHIVAPISTWYSKPRM